jgi:hypothetical protein
MRHFRKDGHPPLKTYYLKHIQQNKVTTKVINKTTDKHLNVKNGSIVLPKIEGTFSMTNVEFNSQVKMQEKKEDKEVCQLFEDRCSYTCTFCSFNCKSWKHMYKHYQWEHPESYNCNKHKASMLMTAKVYHECGVCQMVIMCDRMTIRNHVRQNHGLDQGEYEWKIKAAFIRRAKLSAITV